MHISIGAFLISEWHIFSVYIVYLYVYDGYSEMFNTSIIKNCLY